MVANEDPLGEPIPVVFKAGDDLRQDIMTLQTIRVMDSVRCHLLCACWPTLCGQ